jgi:hypothetical protein
MEASFVIELILSLIFVAGIALKTLRDLRVRYPCHSSASPHEDEEDSCALPNLHSGRMPTGCIAVHSRGAANAS